jgi:Fe-S-cluster containining protein
VKRIFSCRRCGYCCQGQTTVSLDEADIERMGAHLHMSFEEMKKKYLRVTGKVVQMKTVDGHCIFYNQGCTVHPGRPWRCRQWPLHPSILGDPANFQAISTSCPGLKKEMGYDEFCRILVQVLPDQKAGKGHAV